MAFSAAGLNCIAVGPTKLYIYKTADTMLATSVLTAVDGFSTGNCPGMAAGDIVLVAHDTNAKIGLIRITAITAATCTIAQYATLA